MESPSGWKATETIIRCILLTLTDGMLLCAQICVKLKFCTVMIELAKTVLQLGLLMASGKCKEDMQQWRGKGGDE